MTTGPDCKHSAPGIGTFLRCLQGSSGIAVFPGESAALLEAERGAQWGGGGLTVKGRQTYGGLWAAPGEAGVLMGHVLYWP